MNSSSTDPIRNAGSGTPTEERLNLVERMRIEDSQADWNCRTTNCGDGANLYSNCIALYNSGE